MHSCLWGFLSWEPLQVWVKDSVSCFILYVILLLESSAGSSMEFLDSADNFVSSYFEFVGFYLFGVFWYLLYWSSKNSKAYLWLASIICDYLELIFDGEEECIDFCQVLFLYPGLQLTERWHCYVTILVPPLFKLLLTSCQDLRESKVPNVYPLLLPL